MEEKQTYNIALWGLGEQYRYYRNYLKHLEKCGIVNIVGVFSTDNFEMVHIDGWDYYTYDDISKVSYDYFLILSNKYEQIIIENLLEAGVDREKIIPGRVLDLPNFDFVKYIKLKNKRISIISRTCLGGMLSKTLGLEYLSPFRNMNIGEEDYIKLLMNFDYYMSQKLKYTGKQNYNAKEMFYFPLMALDDIIIRYPHFRRASTAINDWEERCNRINYSNMFVFNFTSREDIAEKFSMIPFENKVCFTDFKSEIDSTIYIPPCKKWPVFEHEIHLGLCSGLFVDPVKLLLNEPNCILFD